MKILLIDYMNLAIRNYIVNPTLDVNGAPIGMVAGVIQSLYSLSNKFAPDKIILCKDGRKGRERRKRIYPEYKSFRKEVKMNRQYENTKEENKENKQEQLAILEEVLKNLPFNSVEVETLEGDDIIAYICTSMFKEDEKIVVSMDKDFLQLVTDKVKIFSPVKAKIYDMDEVKKEYGVDVKNFPIAKAILGDKGDNIDNVDGIGLTTINKYLPFLSEDKQYLLSDLFTYCEQKTQEKTKKSKEKYFKILSSKNIIDRNYDLVQLQSGVVNSYEAQQIEDQLKNQVIIFNVIALKLLINGWQLLGNMDIEKVCEKFRYLHFKSKNN